MIAKNGKWETSDKRTFESDVEASIHEKELVEQEAIAAGCTTPEQIKTYKIRRNVNKAIDEVMKNGGFKGPKKK